MNTKNKRSMWLLLAWAVVGLTGCGLIQKAAEFVSSAREAAAKGKVADNLEPSEQYYLGRGVSAVIVDQHPAVEINTPQAERQIAYLNEMAGFIEVASKDVTRSAVRLGDTSNRSYDEQQHVNNLALYKGIQVGILDTDEVAAFGAVGGFLWISRGLIDMCKTEDELAAILAHEMGHILLDHGMANYRRAHKNSITTSYVSENWFSGDGLVSNVGHLCVTLSESLFNGFNPGQEYEADNWATRALTASGYAPEAMLKMLQRVEAYQKEKGVDPDSYLGHHPPIDKRIKAVRDLIAKEGFKGNPRTMTPAAVKARQDRFNAAFK